MAQALTDAEIDGILAGQQDALEARPLQPAEPETAETEVAEYASCQNALNFISKSCFALMDKQQAGCQTELTLYWRVSLHAISGSDAHQGLAAAGLTCFVALPCTRLLWFWPGIQTAHWQDHPACMYVLTVAYDMRT